MPFKEAPLYYANAVGQVRKHPAGYAILCYAVGPRQQLLYEALLTQVGHLLLSRGWNRLLSDQRVMAPFTEAEKAWSVEHWLGQKIARPSLLRVAALLATNVFARLAFAQVLNQAPAHTVHYQYFEEETADQTYLLGLPPLPSVRQH